MYIRRYMILSVYKRYVNRKINPGSIAIDKNFTLKSLFVSKLYF